MSIWIAVTPFLVPQTLKSMSPRWSSSPRMSLRMATRVFASVSGPSLMRPIAMPATGDLMGTPASIRLRVPPQTLAIDELPFDSRISLTIADHVRESLLVRDHPRERSLGERAVADFAPARSAQWLRLAGRVRREVVVEHEALPALARERVDLLFVARGAERRRHRSLGLAALEERRAVNAREDPDLAHDRANGRHVAPVDALALGEHVVADDVVLALFELFLDELLDLREALGPELGGQCFDHLGLRRLVRVVARLLLLDERGRRGSPGRESSLTLGRDVGREGLLLERALRLADRGAHALDELEDGLRRPVGEHERVDDVGLGRLGRAALDHHDRVLRACDDEVDVRPASAARTSGTRGTRR